MQRQGFSTDVKLYNSIIDACRIAGRWRRAVTVFSNMHSCGLQPNTATYTVIVDACCTAPVEDAPEVYEAMNCAGVPEQVAFSTAQYIVTPRRRK